MAQAWCTTGQYTARSRPRLGRAACRRVPSAGERRRVGARLALDRHGLPRGAADMLVRVPSRTVPPQFGTSRPGSSTEQAHGMNAGGSRSARRSGGYLAESCGISRAGRGAGLSGGAALCAGPLVHTCAAEFRRSKKRASPAEDGDHRGRR
ncbi:unnamed protein product [Prorocentrum cordatum]|uniref:Uncharacterized protein n=1 Tax=Prorocentrum cordatum TaxID=2364126 RepID=A0ABN9XLN7_9DINO|nr:unnamed protein product [Polarella glacialis]